MVKMICFDMDGTVADLYSVGGWLADLRSENPRPYREAEPMWNMSELREVLVSLNIEIRIVTWLSKDSSEEYKNEVRQAKREWLDRFRIEDYDHAYRLVFEYIEAFYNTVRIHSHCNFMSPDQFEKLYASIAA